MSHNEGTTQPGILTDSQRQFLRKDRETRKDEHTRQERHKYRRRIRERLRAAMKDFRVLPVLGDLEEFPTDELGAVFDPDDDDESDGMVHLPAALEFFAHAQDRGDHQLYPGLDHQPALADFTEAVEKGVERYAAEKNSAIVSADVDVTINGAIPPETALKELESGRIAASQALRYAALLEHAGVEEARITDAMDEWEAAQSDDE